MTMTALNSYLKRVGIIQKLPVFSNLSWLEKQRIASLSTLQEYRKGEVIRSRGDPADALYCLVSGRVQSYYTNESGKKVHLEFIRRGMYFGIISLLTGQRHSMCFQALNDSLLLVIPKDRFHRMLKSVPRLGLEFSQSLSRRVRRHLLHGERELQGGLIIAVYSPFKGAGSSTYATQLAFALHRESGRKVILASIRPEEADSGPVPVIASPTPRWRKYGPSLSVFSAWGKDLKDHILHDEANIDLLNVSFSPRDPALTQQISAFVTSLEYDYHFVVVDLPNEMNDVVLKTLGQADCVHLVVTSGGGTEYLTARDVVYRIEEEQKGAFSPEKLQVLVSGVRGDDTSFEEINRRIDYAVSYKLPRVEPADLTETYQLEDFFVAFPGPETAYGATVRGIARTVSGVRVGLVLGGGAALGLAHIGVLKVLEEEKIPVDVVVGSSIGALIASLWLTGLSPDAIAGLAREFRPHYSMFKLFDLVVPRSGIIGGRLIWNWLRKRHLGDKTFYATRIPLKIVAYDLQCRQDIVIDSGRLVDAVRKSISIPGIMEPVLEKGQVIIDGGVMNPLPTNVLKEMGIRKIIAVNVLQSPQDVANGARLRQQKLLAAGDRNWDKPALGGLLKFNGRKNLRIKKDAPPNLSDIIVKSLLASEYVISQKSAELADVLIHPDLADADWFEFYKVDQLIEKGEAAARAVLADIKRLCAE
jgi:predicted acylesterase/phospholipase RssA/CRP-like cAMP-binding protein